MAVAIDKYICPFCGQRTLFVGVHDDEGNYKGRPGCEYESDPWSGLCYAIQHDGWGDCILCTGAHDLPLGGCFFDTAEEAFQAIPVLTPPNEPLTLEELREMSYTDWVWVVFPELPSEENGWVRASQLYRLYSHEHYGKTWLAYRRPPEGEA